MIGAVDPVQILLIILFRRDFLRVAAIFARFKLDLSLYAFFTRNAVRHINQKYVLNLRFFFKKNSKNQITHIFLFTNVSLMDFVSNQTCFSVYPIRRIGCAINADSTSRNKIFQTLRNVEKT